MKCIDPDTGKLISLYEFNQLTEEEKKTFEIHLLHCDFCFQSLYEMSPVVDLMRENPQLFLSALRFEKRRALGAKVYGAWSELWSRLRKAFAPLPKPVWAIAPIAAIAMILVAVLITRPTRHYSDLARIEPLPYIPIAMRAGEVRDESEKLFKQGMELYEAGKYVEAIGELSLVIEKDPRSAEAHFYLGLCHLLSYMPDSAIVHLEKAVRLGGGSFAEKCHWYLGNALLLEEDGARALEEFKQVAAIEGDYEWLARDVIAEIEKVKGKSKN